MEEGIVVELADTQDLVWMKNRSRAIPVPHSPRTKRFKIGTTIRIWYSNVGEIMEIEEACTNGSLTVTGNEIKIQVRVIFPPRKLLSKCGLKLFSRSIGIVSANETWRDLFTMAVPVLYEAIIVWCSSSREFVLAPDQTLVPLKDEYPLPTYLEILRDSPWVDLIEVPKKADEIFQEKVEAMIPSYRRHGRDSSSSSDDGIPHTVSPNDFVRIGILFGRKYNDEWEVFVLDCDEMRNQWTIVTERNLNKYCPEPYIGATIEIDLNRFVHFKVDEWCVVDHDDTVVGKNINGIVMLDVAVRVKNIVSIGDKRVTKMHNRRVMDVYDYNNVLGKLEIGETVRVLIKWSRIDRDPIRDRKEWVVHTYGSGETVMPESRKVKRMKKLDRSLKEYCLVEYACDRDWDDNELLRNYRAEYNRHLEEEKWEEARIKQNEAEIEEEEELSPLSKPALVVRRQGNIVKLWIASLSSSIEQSIQDVPKETREGHWLTVELDEQGSFTQIKARKAILPSHHPDDSNTFMVWDWFILDSGYRKGYSRDLGFLDVSNDFVMPIKERIENLSFNLYAIVINDRLVIPKQSIPDNKEDSEKRAKIAQQLRMEIDRSPEIKHFQEDLNRRNGKEITDWMPILITGSNKGLFFFSSKVGDGIIAPSEHRGNNFIKTGAVFNARVEKIAANSQYPRDRLQAVNLSTRPIEVPKDVTIDTRRDDCLVRTIVRVEKDTRDYMLLHSDLIGKCYISRPDIFHDRPIFTNQTIRVEAKRVKSSEPSNWKVNRYEHLTENDLEERRGGVREEKERKDVIEMKNNTNYNVMREEPSKITSSSIINEPNQLVGKRLERNGNEDVLDGWYNGVVTAVTESCVFVASSKLNEDAVLYHENQYMPEKVMGVWIKFQIRQQPDDPADRYRIDPSTFAEIKPDYETRLMRGLPEIRLTLSFDGDADDGKAMLKSDMGLVRDGEGILSSNRSDFGHYNVWIIRYKKQNHLSRWRFSREDPKIERVLVEKENDARSKSPTTMMHRVIEEKNINVTSKDEKKKNNHAEDLELRRIMRRLILENDGIREALIDADRNAFNDMFEIIMRDDYE